MRVRLVVLLTLVSATVSALGDEPAPDIERIRAHVSALTAPEMAGRDNGSTGSRAARAYLAQAYKKLGIEISEQPFKRPLGAGVNVLATLPGADPKLRDEVVILAAHYDHVGTRGGRVYPGANDNACGVAVVLEIARCLAASKARPARTIVFAHWDAEEDGLVGSRHFVSEPKVPLARIAAYVDMDLIGRDLLDILPRTVLVFGTERARGLPARVRAATKGVDLDFVLAGGDLIGPRCDYWSFRAARIPAMFITCGEHADYHKPTDVADRLRYPKVGHIAGVIACLVRDLAGAAPRPVFGPAVHPPAEAAALARIVRAIADKGRSGAIEKWGLRETARRLERIAKKPEIGPADRLTMRVAVAGALLRNRLTPYVKLPRPTPKKDDGPGK